MSKPKILLQIDSDEQPSVFDSVVAFDSGVDRLLRHSAVELLQVDALVHGLMFTRGPEHLKHSAIFIGGSRVDRGEDILRQVCRCFFGPLRVSVMLDANGANTTAAAAVLSAERHLDLADSAVVVLAATGPVGQRVVRLLAGRGARVRAASRSLQRAEEICRTVAKDLPNARLEAVSSETPGETNEALLGMDGLVSAGAAGVELITRAQWESVSSLRVAIDLNAIPPAGIEGIDVSDRARAIGDCQCYGPIGVGGLKMKIHKRAVARLFEQNDLVLDADQIYEIGRDLDVD